MLIQDTKPKKPVRRKKVNRKKTVDNVNSSL